MYLYRAPMGQVVTGNVRHAQLVKHPLLDPAVKDNVLNVSKQPITTLVISQ